MNTTNVLITDGTGMPRRCAIQTPSGSMDAATIEAASIFRGVAGMIIDPTRMTTVFHDRCTASVGGTFVQLLISATPMALATRYRRPASVFTRGACGAYRT